MTVLVSTSPNKGKAYLIFAYDPLLVQVARGIPSHRKYVEDKKCWEFKVTRPAIAYLQQQITGLKMDAGITEYMEDQERRRAEAVQLKSQTEGVTHNDIRDYKFKTKPFDHQAEAFLRSRDLEAFALLMEQGTGKTKVIIDTAAYLFAGGKIDSLIVACPNSVKTNWVYDEIEAHLPDWVEYDAAYWEATAKKAEREALSMLSEPNGKLKILVVNIEGISTKRAEAYALKFARLRKPMLVIDESSRIKKFSTKRSATCRRLGKLCDYRRIMTGTPITQGPMDLYSQFNVLDESILGYGSYYSMRNHFCRMGGYEDKQIIGYKNLDELWEAIAPYSFRVLKKDCLDLPDKLYQKLYVDHTPEQARAYKNMKKNMETDLQDGSITTAKIALTQLARLQQINSNWTMDDEGQLVVIDQKSNPRLDALVHLLEDHGGKAIIWSRYRYDIEEITERLNREFGKGCAAAFYGGVSQEDRTTIRQDFQDSEADLQFFVGNPEAGGIGLTLTEASLVVYYANDFSLETRLQSEDRAHRIGQVRNVEYVDIICNKTVDLKIVKALRDKRDVSQLVTQDNLGEWI